MLLILIIVLKNKFIYFIKDMINHKRYNATLYLEDNTLYKGWSFFDEFYCCGEIVFNTGMTGYQEVMTDPSYSGQILTFTYPELGNTGFNIEDNESNIVHIQGIVAKNISLYHSNWRSNISLKDYLIHYKIPHIFGIDTRALTKHLRNKGVMNGNISSGLMSTVEKYKCTKIQNVNLINKTSTLANYKISNHLNSYINKSFSYLNYLVNKNTISSYNIIILDFGIKHNILKRLLVRGCNTYILSANTPYNTIKEYKPDGIILSNGPGNPSISLNIINNIKKIIHFSSIPIFGICMGHQLLSLAFGRSTYKLKFGHRGLNHPSGINKMAEITSQNHGFAVDKYSQLDMDLRTEVTYFNLNDQTVAGLLCKTQPIFSVQYHPEASPGPHDSDYLFDIFINLIYSLRQSF